MNATGGPVAALLGAYRDFGRKHPNLYRLVTTNNLPRPALTVGLEAWAGKPFYRVTADPYRSQALWAFAHGMLILEIESRWHPGTGSGGSFMSRWRTAGAG